MFYTNSGSRVPVLEKIGQRSRSHWHIMYTIKICLKSVPDSPINFILLKPQILYRKKLYPVYPMSY